MDTLREYVEQLVASHKGVRITAFYFQGQKYWLKQTEQLTGFEHILKPFPEKALQREIEQLSYLNDKQVSTARLVLTGNNYFVTNNVGISIAALLRQPHISITQSHYFVNSAAKALSKLHQQGFIHGRPAIRDITMLEDQIYFIDFENKFSNKSLESKKVRDLLIFIHSLYRAKLSQEIVEQAVESYIQGGGNEIWQATMKYIKNKRWLYWLLSPTKPIARKDLISVIYIFEYILNIK
ncbi:bifunctional UGMP family protein/serine/threonine protein kinase [Phocoenobacter uteri]|uniref:Bifunctional UGMP family protein/serine/threonine protein kinase n=1 Tax=Phocoenobacter uteri TaxID=146806 RepID=A0A379C8X7_9PAST|nr:kinase [Phocoenobacter uteri]MDG6882430.1 hypothetical protein [Phocoenobacter uteri]SUB58588.1 bifunctional UGMP family protein/serine/threonine protein kinase [Phocoenobacter uteri]